MWYNYLMNNQPNLPYPNPLDLDDDLLELWHWSNHNPDAAAGDVELDNK